MTYRGSSRAGYSDPPGVNAGTRHAPLDLGGILDSGFWEFQTNFGENWDQAATMMQPIGGMGRIGQAFGSRLRGLIRYDTEVRALRRSGDGARIVWRDVRSVREQAIQASLVVVTIPFPILRHIPADFSADVRTAIAAADYVRAVKIAFQAERRFWELDEAVYGGISWTTRDITQIWYPSGGIHAQKGILVGAYIWSNDIADRFAAFSLPERLDAALADGERLHARYRSHLTRGVSVAWGNVPFSCGAWAQWSREARTAHYATLLQGDGPFLFAGEHLSYINGWQEGAVRSAHFTLQQIAKRFSG
jgi:monoamine oxidase